MPLIDLINEGNLGMIRAAQASIAHGALSLLPTLCGGYGRVYSKNSETKVV